MTNPEGRVVVGELSADGTTWTSGEPLGYARTYTIEAVARDAAGLTTASSSSFATVAPAGVISRRSNRRRTAGSVGVGQPISVLFDKAPPDKAAPERAVMVTTVPAQVGGWYWVDERIKHLPAPGVLAGRDPGHRGRQGLWGEPGRWVLRRDRRTLNLTIGQSKIATVDDATKIMTVTIDGQVVRQFSVSMGRDESTTVDGKVISFITPSGIYVAQEKYDVQQMNSGSYGLPASFDLGFDSAIPLAVRLSNSGIFAHSAPWSVADQGIRNVSHGCINMPPADAQWFYDTFSYGDIVQVTGTSTQLAPDDGYGDRNIGWDEWVQGSALT